MSPGQALPKLCTVKIGVYISDDIGGIYGKRCHHFFAVSSNAWQVSGVTHNPNVGR